VLTLVLAWVCSARNVDQRLLVGAAAIVAGAVILSWPNENINRYQPQFGMLVAGACLAWAIDKTSPARSPAPIR